MAEWNPVTFYQGAPIDASQLNKLQQNITQAWTASNNLLVAATVQGEGQQLLPVITSKQATVVLNTKGVGSEPVEFANVFTTTPSVIACLAQDPKEKQYTVSAVATGTNTAKVYVVGPASTSVTVTVIGLSNKVIAKS